MRRDRRFQLTLGLAVGASLAFLAFLLVRPVGDGSVRLTANLASCWRRRRPRAAMLSFPGRAERAALQARSLLDGAVIATSLLYTSWALVLGHVQVGTSVGVTVSDASEVDAVLHEADVAMYTEKARGKGRFELASTSA